ncbi:UDP-glucose 4-epimerase GalE [Thermodesulfovibrionales bacterium]|nr:UDP-glucose 4-epimerase GalE [Thermodesulfovibrionales bacterium]MCL0046965.1 UDP-glucose 4-epimerase GalE [Thermodesulfovibrionales bacterium]MCL0051498.1 UDP-glucose 4-epimerase GalE [Thermodesulfovibrionales bacterium]
MAKVLVTGGAGYIGSHVVKLLGEKDYDVVVYDNLSTGTAKAVLYGQLVEGDILNLRDLKKAIDDFKPDAVMHFAAKIVVPESVKYPLLYYTNNVFGTLNVLEAMRCCGVNKFIFSSTAAVYGEPVEMSIVEETPFRPINPYGKSKAMIEEVLKDFSAAEDFRYVSLRYFNVAGADPSCTIGETKKDATHLITMCVRTALGKREKLLVYGTDYPTRNGSCIRDYIHVADLADAHVLSLEYLLKGERSDVFNCGYGRGYSVLEVVRTVRRVSGADFHVEYVNRRAGDPAVLISNPNKIKSELDWKPKYNDLDFIIKTAWEWEKRI